MRGKDNKQIDLLITFVKRLQENGRGHSSRSWMSSWDRPKSEGPWLQARKDSRASFMFHRQNVAHLRR